MLNKKTNLVLLILFFAFFSFFTYSDVIYADEIPTHYKKITKKYEFELLENSISYGNRCEVVKRTFDGSEFAAVSCDARTETVPTTSIERKAFPQKIGYTNEYKLEALIVSGEECTKPTNVDGVSTQGCSEISVTTSNAFAIDKSGVTHQYMMDQTEKINALLLTNNILMFNYIDDIPMSEDEVKSMCQNGSSFKYECNDNMLTYYLNAFGEPGTYHSDETLEQTYYARGTNAFDRYNTVESEVGNYVCIATAISDQFNVSLDNIGAHSLEHLNGNDSWYGYYILANAGSTPEQVMENCKKVFPQKIYYETFAAGTSYYVYNFFNLAVYKITKAEQKPEKLNISEESSGLTCGWQVKDGDETYNVNAKFWLTMSGKYGAIGFNSGENLGELHTSVRLSTTDIENMLNEKDSFKNAFANSINSKKPNDGITTTKVAATVLGIAAIAVIGVTTFGAGAAIGVAVIGGFALKVAGTAALVGIVYLGADVVGGFIKEAQKFSNTVPTKAWVYYNAGEKGKGDKVSANCYYSEFAADWDINSDVTVSCETILEGEFGKILSYIMNILRFVGCALMILFGAIDFIKPIVSGDAEMLQKSGGKFIKRLIVFVLILFVPAIVELLLSLIGKQSCDL